MFPSPGPIEVHFKLRWADDGTWLLDPTFPTTASESPEPINNCVQLLGRPVPVIVEWPGEAADFGVAGTFSSWRVLPLDSMTQTCEIVALPGAYGHFLSLCFIALIRFVSD